MNKQSKAILDSAFEQYQQDDLRIRQITARASNAFKFRCGEAIAIEIAQHPNKYRNHKLAYYAVSEYIKKKYLISYNLKWFETAYYTTKLQKATKDKILKEFIPVSKVNALVIKPLEDVQELEAVYLKNGNIFPDKRTQKKPITQLDHGDKAVDPECTAVVLPYPYDEETCIDRLCNYISTVAGRENGLKVLDEVKRRCG